MHHFLLATYNIDPLNYFVKKKKNKKNKFITFANVACYATLANPNVAWHATLGYGLGFFFIPQYNLFLVINQEYDK
jgi:hypothetical protein